MLQTSDIYVALGLLVADGRPWTYRELAERLGVSLPLIQRSLARCEAVELYVPSSRRVHLPNLEELLLHAIRFVAPGRLEGVVAGIPAAWAAEPMASRISEGGDELPPVWPSAKGRVRGQALRPLHEAAVEAVSRDARLGELLSLADALRAGDVRVRGVAADLARDAIREVARAR